MNPDCLNDENSWFAVWKRHARMMSHPGVYAQRCILPLLTVAFMLSGCVSVPASGSGAAAEARQTSVSLSAPTADVYEAVVRHQLQHCDEGLVTFIKVQDTDPDPAFLQRFSGGPRVVKPLSASRKLKDSSIADKTSGKRGCIIGPDGIRWLDSNTAEVWGGVYHSVPGAEWSQYIVKRYSGRWRVSSSTVKQTF